MLRALDDRCDRRTFVRRAAGLLACAGVGADVADLGRGARTRLAIVLVDDDGPSARACAMGVTMGAEEADRTARMFGGGVRLERVDRAHVARAIQPRRGELACVLGGDEAHACATLATTSAENGAIYVNALCASDELRGRRCARAMFHVAPSEAMIADARSRAGHADDAVRSRVVAWDDSLQPFGADVLNQRFRARFDTPMTGDAWAGWFAVKAMSEAVLRVPDASVGALTAYLESDRATVDGHKGRPLGFRAWDHQLRQPLYVVASGASAIVEVPTARDASGRDSRTLLDEVGTTREATSCTWDAR